MAYVLLPEGWTEWGVSYLNEINIDHDNYQVQVVKNRLMDSLAASFTFSLVEDIESDPYSRLYLNRSNNSSRWVRGETLPHARIFFGLLVVGLQKEFDEVSLPRNRKAIWEASRRTIAMIRKKEMKERVYGTPERAQIACVRRVLNHPDSEALLDGHKYKARQERLYEDVLKVMQQQYAIRTVEKMQEAICQWLRPYVLFRLGLLPDWEMFDEQL